MEFRDLLPMIGVAIGWLLKEVSDVARYRGEERRELGNALVGLLQLDAELHRLTTFLDFQKNREISWEQYERIRVETSQRYLNRTDPSKAIESAALALSRRDPVRASHLRDIPYLLTSFARINLEPMGSKPEDYIKWLSSLEVSVDLSATILKKFILQL